MSVVSFPARLLWHSNLEPIRKLGGRWVGSFFFNRRFQTHVQFSNPTCPLWSPSWIFNSTNLVSEFPFPLPTISPLALSTLPPLFTHHACLFIFLLLHPYLIDILQARLNIKSCQNWSIQAPPMQLSWPYLVRFSLEHFLEKSFVKKLFIAIIELMNFNLKPLHFDPDLLFEWIPRLIEHFKCNL